MHTICKQYWTWALLLGLLLGACSVPLHYEIKQAQLQQKLEQTFPLEAGLEPLFSLHLHNPELGLLPEENRLSTRMRLQMQSPLSKKYNVSGTVAISYALKFRVQDASVLLTQPRITELALDQVQQDWIIKTVNTALNQWLHENPTEIVIYTLSADQHQRLQANEIEEVTFQVLPQAVRIQLQATPFSLF